MALIVEEGRQAVWQHMGEAGMREDIALISKYFDIKDVILIFNGKMTYTNERPRKSTRIAVATIPDKKLNDYLKELRAKK